MSKDPHQWIVDLSHEAAELLAPVAMPMEVAVQIHSKLEAFSHHVENWRRDESDLLDIIEGLLANWPSTEAATLYSPPSQTRPVFMKGEALRRAAEMIRNRSNFSAHQQNQTQG